MPVDTKHPQYQVREQQWSRCRDVATGMDAVKLAGTKYLPKLAEQSSNEYDSYKKRASFYGATRRTIQALTGHVFRKDPIIENFQDEDVLDNIGLGWMDFDALAQKAVSEMLTTGRIGLLTDMPAGVENAAPYVAIYRAEDITNWRIDDVGNPVQVILRETFLKEDPDDEWGQKPDVQYRVLELLEGTYIQRLFRKIEDQWTEMTEVDGVQYPIIPSRTGKNLDFIPFCFANSTHVTSDTEEPPLLDLVDMNLSHYRSSADMEHGAHHTALPTAWVAGFDASSKLRIGSTVAWVSEDSTAKAGFLEFTGQGLGALGELLKSKEQKMAVLGARLLEEQKRVAEAAETHRIRSQAESAALSVIVATANTALSKTLFYVSFWLSRNEEPDVQLNDDFVSIRMGPQELTSIMQARQAGEISQQTFLYNLERGELLPPGTIEDELDRLEAEGPVFMPVPNETETSVIVSAAA